MVLDGVRAIAFLSVFLSHTCIGRFMSLGSMGVSLFLVLSGFVTVYRYLDSDSERETDFGIRFIVRKMKWLYILHVICLVGTILVSEAEEYNFLFGLKLVLNGMMAQTFVPIENVSINGPSWYLGVIVIFYLILPFVLKIMKSYYSKKRAMAVIGVMLFVMIAIGLLGRGLVVDKLPNWMDSNLTKWVVYYFPLSRLEEIIIGCNLGYLFYDYNKGNRPRKENKLFYSGIEIGCILLLFICNFIFMYYRNAYGDISSNRRWWTYSLLFIVPSILVVACFSQEGGVVSSIVKHNGRLSKLICYLANISPMGFLIHMVVLKSLSRLYVLFGINGRIRGIIDVFLGLGLTICLSELFLRFRRFCERRKRRTL